MSSLVNPALPATVEDECCNRLARSSEEEAIEVWDIYLPLWPEGCRVIPVDDFAKPELKALESNAQDWEIKPPELPPGVAGVLIFDLEDSALARFPVNQQRIRLTPAFAAVVLEFEPRSRLKLESRVPKRV